MERDSFIFYRSFYESIQELDSESQCECYNAVIGYALNGTMPKINGVAKAVFLAIKPQIDANNKRYVDGCKGAEYGKRGGRPRTKNPIGVIDENPIGVMKALPSKTPNENVNENENVNVNEKKESKRTTSRAFSKPTIEEITAYCKERGNGIDAQTFYDFYESKGWMIGKNHMKDWKACVRTWERKDAGKTKTNKFNQFTQNDYDFNELEKRLIAN